MSCELTDYLTAVTLAILLFICWIILRTLLRWEAICPRFYKFLQNIKTSLRRDWQAYRYDGFKISCSWLW
jgi:hypothetical protein